MIYFANTGVIAVDKCDCACTGKTIATVATAIAVALSENLTDEEQVVIGSLFTQIADILLSINAINALCGPNDEVLEGEGRAVTPEVTAI